MPERACYQLAARSPFHFGERGVGIEEASLVLHSDTLFSALCLTLRELGQDLDKFLGQFPRLTSKGLEGGPPPLRLSSAYPYAGSVLFFPRPMLRLNLDRDDAFRLRKRLKWIRFVSKPILEAILSYEPIRDLLLDAKDEVRKDVLLQGDRVWVTPDEFQGLGAFEDKRSGKIRLWEEGTVPHVRVDRVTNRSEVYSAGRVRFASGAGLFFLAEFGPKADRERFELAMRVLGDSGVGGERSSGHGQFSLECLPPLELREPQDADGYATLSLYWPQRQEVEDGILNDAHYSIVNRRGWVASPDAMNLRQLGVRMLAEGSVFSKRTEGALANVRPLDDPSLPQNVPHDVWRYGLAFPVRCRLAKGEEVRDG